MAACVGALLVIATVLAFGVQDRLIWDDLELIGGLPSKTSAGSLMTVFGGDFFARGADAAELHYYRPIVQLTYLLGALFWNADPWAYGVSNLVFHLTACLLLFALLGRFGATPLAATLGTLAFGLMPRLTESVFWISGRTDLLASVFVLAALLAWDVRHAGSARRWLGAALIFLGLLCKEVALAGAVALVVGEIVWARRIRTAPEAPANVTSLRRVARRIAPLGAALLTYATIRLLVLDGAWRTSLSLGAAGRLALAAETFGRYLAMLADPLHPALRIGSLFAPRDPWWIALGLVGAVVCGGGLTWLVWRARTTGGPIGLALAGASIGLVLHLAPIGSDAVAADRFLYVPTIGLVIAGVVAASRLGAAPRRLVGAFAAVSIVAFGAACLARAGHWSDETRLWHHTLLRADPHDSLPHAWMGLALLDRDEPAAALGHFGRAFRIEMGKPPAHRKSTLVLEQLASSSVALSALGRDREALHAIDQALAHRPGHLPYLDQRVRVLARMLRFDEALATLAEAQRTHGERPELRTLAAEIGAAQSLLAALPKPRADEPTAVRVQRARILGQLGADAAAAVLWNEVAARDATEPVDDDVLLAAAEFFTFRGAAARAEELIARTAARSSAHGAQTAQLSEVLDARRRTAVAPEILAYAADLRPRS